MKPLIVGLAGLGLLVLSIGCVGAVAPTGDDTGGDPPDAGTTPDPDGGTPSAFAFAGIESVASSGDELLASWSPATGAGAIGYTLIVETVDGQPIALIDVTTTTATAIELADGEYRLRVHAADEADGTGDGGASIVQLVGDNRIVFRSRIEETGIADVWGDGELVYVAGKSADASFYIIDTADPVNPKTLAAVSNEGFVKDVKSGDGYLYINGEGTGAGARIFDISDPSNPVKVGTISSPSSVHNLSYGNHHLYLTDNGSGAVKIFDVSDPTNPVQVSRWDPPRSSVHDQAVVDDKMYVAFWAGFAVVDVSDPANPVDLVVHYYSDSTSATHNVWPSADGSHVLTSDETTGGHMRIFDISDPDNVEQVATWAPEQDAMVHNVHVEGDYAFLAHYTGGMRVLDISTPSSPVEVGFYNPEHGGGPGSMSGTWGVWPHGAHVAIGSTAHGLYIVDFFPLVVTQTTPTDSPPM